MEEKYIYVVVKSSGNSDKYDGWNDPEQILYAFEDEYEARKYARRKLVSELCFLCDDNRLDDFEVDSDDDGFNASYGFDNDDCVSYNVEKIRFFEKIKIFEERN